MSDLENAPNYQLIDKDHILSTSEYGRLETAMKDMTHFHPDDAKE